MNDVFRRDSIQAPMTIISLSPFIGKSTCQVARACFRELMARQVRAWVL